MYNHIDLKNELMKHIGIISPYDYLRSVNYKTNAYTDFYLNKVNNLVTKNSKYIITLNISDNKDAVVLYNPNLYNILQEIHERFIKNEISSAYDKDRNRVLGHFESETRLRIGNKSSEYMYIDFDLANLNNLIKKHHYKLDSHSGIQSQLLNLGLSLGYDVKVAINDNEKISEFFSNKKLKKISTINIDDLNIERINGESKKIIDRIDVIWVEKNLNQVIASFEVELSGNYKNAYYRLGELINNCKYSKDIYSIIVSDKDNIKTASDNTKSSNMNLIYNDNNLYFLSINSLKDILVLKDRYGFGNHKDLLWKYFVNEQLKVLNDNLIQLPKS